MTVEIPCSTCKWYLGGGRCLAFRDEPIPLEIIEAKNDHTQPYPGDNGIQYERAEEEAQDGG